VGGKVKSVLGPYRQTFESIGRSNVHAVTGNHDYYARNAFEKSLFFGLVNIEFGPIGLSERGNERERAVEWWTYYYKMPADAVYPVRAGSKDSVQFIFYDSALPLRTDPSTWHSALDSLRRLLTHSANRPGIAWRILAQHHPWYSVGEHGGYSVWDDEAKTVNYLPNCDKDSNVIEWFVNTLDPQDLCASKYQAEIDSLKAIIHAGGAKIHLMLAGHEHNLQLLSYPERTIDCPECPTVFVISGAGSKSNKVKLPSPPNEFTASQPAKNGESLSGFAQLKFEDGKLRVVFFNSANGELIDMGETKKEFWLDRNGLLLH
ncbi:MAG: metallophosphoesterase, partial [bacterium]